MPGAELFADFMDGRGGLTGAELSELRDHEAAVIRGQDVEARHLAMLRVLGAPAASVVLSREKEFKIWPLGAAPLLRRGLHVWRVVFAHYAAKRRAGALGCDHFLGDGLIEVKGLTGNPDLCREAAAQIRALPPAHKKTDANLLTNLDAVVLEKPTRLAWPWVRDLCGLDALPDAPIKHRANAFAQHLVRGPDDDDEQATPHSDCFMPAVKWWWFPEAVAAGALRYARGSAELTPAMLAFHYRESNRVAAGDVEPWRLGRGRGHVGGSLRFGEDELAAIGLDCRPIEVEADTLLIANVFGVHARGMPAAPTARLAVHGSIRPARPFE